MTIPSPASSSDRNLSRLTRGLAVVFAFVALAFLRPANGIAADDDLGIPHDPALEQAILSSDLPMISVEFDGMKETLASYARLELSHITGRQSLPGQAPEYTLLSMLFEPEKWVNAKIFPVESEALFPVFDIGPKDRKAVSLTQIFQPDTEVKLRKIERELGEKEVRAADQLLGRAMAFVELPDRFRVCPNPGSLDGAWLAPAQLGQAPPESQLASSTRLFQTSLGRAFGHRETTLIPEATDKFLGVMSQSEFYPPRWNRKLSDFYASFKPLSLTYMAYLLACVVFGVYLYVKRRSIYFVALAIFVAGFLLHTTGVASRYMLSGRWPTSNLYESIVFATWGMAFMTLVAECISRRALVGFPASGLGFVLMVAISFFPLNMTRIEPLRAVLNSAWLTYHVSSMLLSYSAFMLSFLFAALYLVKQFTGPRLGWLPHKDLFDQFNYRAVQIGWPLITFGIFAGGVWANTAWGRFWSWDPKETWALITWLIYTIYLHLRLNQGWKGGKAAWTTVIGFLCVLMTWYGVSFLKLFAGGLHSYA